MLKLNREAKSFPIGGMPINRNVDRSLVPGLLWEQEREPREFESPRSDQFWFLFSKKTGN